MGEKTLYLTLTISVLILTGCKNNIDKVEGSCPDDYQSITYKQLLENQPGFKRYEWKELKTDRGETYVEFRGYFKNGVKPELDKFFRGYYFTAQYLIHQSDNEFSVKYFGFSIDTILATIPNPAENINFPIPSKLALSILYDQGKNICDYYYTHLS